MNEAGYSQQKKSLERNADLAQRRCRAIFLEDDVILPAVHVGMTKGCPEASHLEAWAETGTQTSNRWPPIPGTAANCDCLAD